MTTRALEDWEIRAVFENVEGQNATRNFNMLILCIGMALRASELVGLKVGDIYDGKKVKTYVKIRGETAKFGKEREIRIGDDIKKCIADFLEWKERNRESLSASAPLFVSQKGGHLTRVALFQIVKKIFSSAGVEQSLHALRKTGATLYYIESEYDLIATQLFLGHSDPSTTREYIGLATDKIVEYSERISRRLFSAIYAEKIEEFNTNANTLNSSIKDLSDADLTMELSLRGYDMSSIIEQMQKDRDKRAKIIRFPSEAL